MANPDGVVDMRWWAMLKPTLLFACFALFFAGLWLDVIGSETPGRMERLADLVALPLFVVAAGFVASGVNLMARSPVRFSEEGLFLPGYWRHGKREIPWTAIKRTYVRPLPYGAAELRLKLKDGSSRRVALGFVENPESFRSEVAVRVMAANRQDDIW